MGIPHLATMAVEELAASWAMTEGQVREILLQTTEHETPRVTASIGKQYQLRVRPKRRKREALRQKGLKEAWSSRGARIELLSAKGSSSWLTTLPLKEHGFWRASVPSAMTCLSETSGQRHTPRCSVCVAGTFCRIMP